MTDNPYPWFKPLEENRTAEPGQDAQHAKRSAPKMESPDIQVPGGGENNAEHSPPATTAPVQDGEAQVLDEVVSAAPPSSEVSAAVLRGGHATLKYHGHDASKLNPPYTPAASATRMSEPNPPPSVVPPPAMPVAASPTATPSMAPTGPMTSRSPSDTNPIEFAVTRDVLLDVVGIIKNNPMTWILGLYISMGAITLAMAPFFFLFLREFFYSLQLLIFTGFDGLAGFIVRNLFYFLLLFLVLGVLLSCFVTLIVRGQLHEMNGRKMTLASFFRFDAELMNGLKATLPVHVALALAGAISTPVMMLEWFLAFPAHYGITQELSSTDAAKASYRLSTRNAGLVGLSRLVISVPFGLLFLFIYIAINTGSALGLLLFFFFVVVPPVGFAFYGVATSLYLRIEHGDLGVEAGVENRSVNSAEVR